MPRICQRCKKRECRVGHWCQRCRAKRGAVLKKMHARRAAGASRKSTVHHGRSYAARSILLKEIGFDSYKEYLQSDLWKDIRFRVFMTKGTDCHLCKEPASQVHHVRYTKATLIGKKLKHLLPICGGCHYKIEFTRSEKLTVKQSGKKLNWISRQMKEQAPPEFVQSQ